MDYFLLEDEHALKGEFLEAPQVYDSLLAAGGEGAVAGRGLGAGEVVVGLSKIADDLELALRVAFVDHHSSIQGADNE